jgi:hypothetical protein
MLLITQVHLRIERRTCEGSIFQVELTFEKYRVAPETNSTTNTLHRS